MNYTEKNSVNTEDMGELWGDTFSEYPENDDGTVTDEEERENRSKTKKTALIIIAGGAALIMLILFIVPRVQRKNVETVENPTYTPTATPVYNNSIIYDEKPEEDSAWKELSKDTDISYSTEDIDTVMQITSIKYYGKTISDKSVIVIKTVVTGAVDGFSGVYELEIPFKAGRNLNIGDRLYVKVRMGEYKGTTVIDTIQAK